MSEHDKKPTGDIDQDVPHLLNLCAQFALHCGQLQMLGALSDADSVLAHDLLDAATKLANEYSSHTLTKQSLAQHARRIRICTAHWIRAQTGKNHG